MRQNQFTELFRSLDPEVQTMLAEVIVMEQEFISYEKPRIKERLDDIITRAAKSVLQRNSQPEKEAQ